MVVVGRLGVEVRERNEVKNGVTASDMQRLAGETTNGESTTATGHTSLLVASARHTAV